LIHEYSLEREDNKKSDKSINERLAEQDSENSLIFYYLINLDKSVSMKNINNFKSIDAEYYIVYIYIIYLEIFSIIINGRH